MLLILGATFFSFTLYSGEIIAALVKSNLLTINLEEISDDGDSKNRKMLANRQLEEVASKLLNTEKSLLDSSQELSKLEMARKGLQLEKQKLKQSIEKLKFELVDQQNKKKLAESNTGKFETQLEALRTENDRLRDKINVLDKVALDKTELEKALNSESINKSSELKTVLNSIEQQNKDISKLLSEQNKLQKKIIDEVKKK